ncbi:MAG: hypothetical protein IJ555_00790 [Ruminococcus sp.]|nr:hypothetical protein [Ruminococcus sp.]
MKIVPYDAKYKNDFIELNKAWIIDMFHEIEPIDLKELGNIEATVNNGGNVFFPFAESRSRRSKRSCKVRC